MEVDEVLDTALPWERARRPPARRLPHLVLAWSFDEPDRLGEVVPIAVQTSIGRGGPLADDPAPRTGLHQMRPGSLVAGPPFASARIGRCQLVVEPRGEDEVFIRSIGPARVRVSGKVVTEASARAGDIVEIHNAAVFLVTSRPAQLPDLTAPAPVSFAYGAPDPFGMIGESESAWKVREAIAFAASTSRHVLIIGESGVGKELAARAVHGLSDRRARTFIARNAATMPESLLDAELFGNVKNYPNPGMPERPGLIGEADESTLFLDEIGDLPEKSQVHLLRVLDDNGEYHRLGEAQARRSSFRLVAATNRPLDMLKHDFLARFTHRIVLPGLTERRDDVPLMLAEILRRTARSNPAIAARFFEVRKGEIAEPRLAPDFVIRLLRHPFTHHVRELERLVWLALGTADADYIGITPDIERELALSAEAEVDVSELDRDTIARALAEHGRSPTKAAKALGLKNRYVLLRLLKKHGLSANTEGDEP
ncbi:MAG TPA: sigma 54-interacting transcriptional regulator [Kofleriaceae bacterium]|nr:sigma 54-interacting transcriptional regulator [Kofleriaceae bacterium]